MIDLVVFLGNPGKQYVRTRHNVPWMLLDYLESTLRLSWQEKFHGRIADFFVDTRKLRFLVPQTFMNVSGKSVAAAMSFFNIEIDRLLVIHDEIELPFGTLALRRGGGLAGHKGLKSIKQTVGSGDFRRLRIGVGRPERGSVQSWVLGRFDPIEEEALPLVLGRAEVILREAAGESNGVHADGKPVRVWG